MRNSIHKIHLAISLVASVLITAACGGGGGLAGGGIGGTGITAFGTITGFGSVFVNGIEFETSGTAFDVDGDQSALESDLGIGMVVTVTGTLNEDGVTGTATSIVFDDEIEGPVSLLSEDTVTQTKTFSVLDTTVIARRGSTAFANTTYDAVDDGDVVEISGFADEAGNLVATRLEGKGLLVLGTTEVEIKGTVSGCTGDCAGTFSIGSVAVDYDPAGATTDLTEMVPAGVVSGGQFVEVKGILTAANAIDATRIELEDEGFDDTTGDNKVSIEGFVSAFSGIDSFRVAGQRVDATGAVFSPASLEASLANGMEVEVEGPIVSGVLQAVKVEAREGDIEIEAQVQSTTPATGSITLALIPGNLTVIADSQTALRDDIGADDVLSLSEIRTSDFLEVRAFRDDASGDLIATEIRRRDRVDDDILEGPVDSCAGIQVTILGISYTLADGTTEYRDQNEILISPQTAAEFCTRQQDAGLFVKVKDEQPANGVADEAELQD